MADRPMLTPCPLCSTTLRCVPSLAYRVSGENAHRYSCPDCGASLSGTIRGGVMNLVPVTKQASKMAESPVAHDPSEAFAKKLMDGME